MKKIIMIILVVALASTLSLGLFACGGNIEEKKGVTDETVTAAMDSLKDSVVAAMLEASGEAAGSEAATEIAAQATEFATKLAQYFQAAELENAEKLAIVNIMTEYKDSLIAIFTNGFGDSDQVAYASDENSGDTFISSEFDSAAMAVAVVDMLKDITEAVGSDSAGRLFYVIAIDNFDEEEDGEFPLSKNDCKMAMGVIYTIVNALDGETVGLLAADEDLTVAEKLEVKAMIADIFTALGNMSASTIEYFETMIVNYIAAESSMEMADFLEQNDMTQEDYDALDAAAKSEIDAAYAAQVEMIDDMVVLINDIIALSADNSLLMFRYVASVINAVTADTLAGTELFGITHTYGDDTVSPVVSEPTGDETPEQGGRDTKDTYDEYDDCVRTYKQGETTFVIDEDVENAIRTAELIKLAYTGYANLSSADKTALKTFISSTVETLETNVDIIEIVLGMMNNNEGNGDDKYATGGDEEMEVVTLDDVFTVLAALNDFDGDYVKSENDAQGEKTVLTEAFIGQLTALQETGFGYLFSALPNVMGLVSR